MKAIEIIISLKLACTNNEARRLIQQGGFRVNGKVITVEFNGSVHDLDVPIKDGDIVHGMSVPSRKNHE